MTLPVDSPFGQDEEPAIVSLALDFPEFFVSVANFITPEVFSNFNVRYIMANVLNYYSKHGIVPTRAVLKSRILKQLTADSEYEEILNILARTSDHREVPILKEVIQKWAEHKTYSLLYSDEAQEAHARGDYDFLKNIVSQASRITDIGKPGFWLFQQTDELFIEDGQEHISTGYKQLDLYLNGGPSPGEVLIWMAPTGVGKSILLANNAMNGVKQSKNVLFVTFELSTLKTALRIVGSMTKKKIADMRPKSDKFVTARDEAVQIMTQTYETFQKDIVIYEMAPGECSVNHIYAIIDSLKKTKNWKPDIVIIDYLELMVSRNVSFNTSEYSLQKNVSTEVRGLAKNENVVVFTATQTNRAGLSQSSTNTAENIGLDKSAESYGKNMAADYVISLNQNEMEYHMTPAVIRFFIAKNREGQKYVSVKAEINYENMFVREA